MIRAQIQLEASTYEKLKKYASEAGCSVAEIARRSIEETLTKRDAAGHWQRSMEAVGRYRSGLGDLSTNHDKHLGDEW
jgi:hypothetical protein